MRRRVLAVLPLVLAALLPGSAAGQFFWGGHAAYTGYQDGGTGAGLHLGLDFPLLPVDVVGSAEWFSPSCRADREGCSLWGATLDANLRLPIPLVRPYLTGGLSYRKFGLGGELGSQDKSGINLGVGVDVNLGIRAFADWRWEFLGESEAQEFGGWVGRIGLNFNL